ncbi:MAG: UDP-N-acetylmuramoyl-tripeptide--D-alanyl-D-alanine ligase [uncultured Solirubrobacteraceae bacterium]|uniref:UDP-N-acetylmuramoyl-tripeptide--D-alanyl-D-alanine ligase n=1 Tax=uncultured Solirubrobacteraceae bacterium TaxID=1162706 RepID=A0A6J4S6B2_9ACTN|nr:MAG: UDP-N-acetylmuramoyl-tripeptide--D-alanyl-D-alanine ligase [uncultured Solirubrobacteraceae bacterium]
MNHWDATRLASAAGARMLRAAAGDGGPRRVVIDSRTVGEGDLFVAIPGARVDGGAYARAASAAGAWGVVVQSQWADEALAESGAVLVAEDPVGALGALARDWRRELGAAVIAVTGSVGKTSTKDLIAAMIRPHRRLAASRANFNTEIGLPLELLAAPAGTEVLVLELGMRGFGQIAELATICEPDVGVITNIAPVHLEQVGDLDGVARAKGELLVGLRDGGHAVVPAGEPRLEPWLRGTLAVTRFGPGGDVDWVRGSEGSAIAVPGSTLTLDLNVTQAHQRSNALAAAAAALAVGVRPSGRVDVAFSALRGEHVDLPGWVVLINDCYNANPLSMGAALEDLGAHETAGRRIAVLGDMLELGAEEDDLHRRAGAQAALAGVEVLITVGPRARLMADEFPGEVHAVADADAAAGVLVSLQRAGDVVLVKGSRGVGLERVAERLGAGTAGVAPGDDGAAVGGDGAAAKAPD